MRTPLAILSAVSATTLLMAASPAADPWTKVPKFSTACYSSQDDFHEQTRAAADALQQEIDRQADLNMQLQQRVNDQDPAEQASRMQSYMMEHPEEAAELMQAMQGMSTAAEADIQTESQNAGRLKGELGEIRSRYQAALDKVLGPLEASLRALATSETLSTAQMIAAGTPIIKQVNAEYEKACPAWWGASGPFHDWLKRYKDHLVADTIPYRTRLDDAKRIQFKIAGIPDEPYRSTAGMKAVLDYMKQADDLLGERRSAPTPERMLP